MFKFYFDGVQVNDPINWSEFTETIVRDDIIKGLLPRYDITLNFEGSGYAYISEQKRLNGYCRLIELKIDESCDGGNYQALFKGYIFISDCIFKLTRCVVECKVVDDNFGARIYNNKGIKTYLDTGKSKNGTVITNAAYQTMQVFSPVDVMYLPDARRTIFFYDAFRFLIDFMTDGQVGFESDYLNYATLDNIKGDQANKIGVLTGEELRLFTHNKTPFISFDNLFEEVNKKFPLMFTIIRVAGKPTIKIENEDYFVSKPSVLKIENIADLQESFSNEKLYANIKFNAPYKDYDGVMYNFPQTRFLGFGKEEYYFQSECNTENALDLTCDFICDSNIIEGMVDTANTEDGYDEDIFFIEGAPLYPTTLAYAQFSPITGAGPWYYNEHLQNNFIAERHMLANSVALYLNNDGDGFMATKTSNEIFVDPVSPVVISIAVPYESSPIAFQDETTPPNYDTNSNYNNTTYRYTSPANGVYTFETSLKYEIASIAPEKFVVYFRYDVYDASNVLQYTYYSGVQQTIPISANVTDTLTSVDGFFMPASYYTVVRLGVKPEADATIFNILALLTGFTGSYFRTVSTENGGGVYQENDPKNYYISKFIFDYPLSKDQYDILKQDLSAAITINYSPTTDKVVWIRQIDRKLATGETNFEMISNIENSN